MTDYRNTIKIIGFDLDQTLYPKSPEIDEAIQSYLYQKIAAAKKWGTEEAERLFKNLYRYGKGLSGGKTLQALGIPNGNDVVQEALEHADLTEFLKPSRATQNLLRQLKDRYQAIDIITGANRKNTTYKLEHLAIPENTFSRIITADDASKSDGSAYRQWLNAHQEKKPASFLYVGDRISSDHEVPSAFGIQTMLVNVSEKAPSVACLQLNSLHDIAGYLL